MTESSQKSARREWAVRAAQSVARAQKADRANGPIVAEAPAPECPICVQIGGYCGGACNGAYNWYRQ